MRPCRGRCLAPSVLQGQGTAAATAEGGACLADARTDFLISVKATRGVIARNTCVREVAAEGACVATTTPDRASTATVEAGRVSVVPPGLASTRPA